MDPVKGLHILLHVPSEKSCVQMTQIAWCILIHTRIWGGCIQHFYGNCIPFQMLHSASLGGLPSSSKEAVHIIHVTSAKSFVQIPQLLDTSLFILLCVGLHSALLKVCMDYVLLLKGNWSQLLRWLHGLHMAPLGVLHVALWWCCMGYRQLLLGSWEVAYTSSKGTPCSSC